LGSRQAQWVKPATAIKYGNQESDCRENDPRGKLLEKYPQ